MWVWFTCRLLQCRSHLLMPSKVGRAASSRTPCLSSGRCRLSISIGHSRPFHRRPGSPGEPPRPPQRGQALVLLALLVADVVALAPPPSAPSRPSPLRLH